MVTVTKIKNFLFTVSFNFLYTIINILKSHTLQVKDINLGIGIGETTTTISKTSS